MWGESHIELNKNKNNKEVKEWQSQDWQAGISRFNIRNNKQSPKNLENI